jgi:hypothetical protein
MITYAPPPPRPALSNAPDRKPFLAAAWAAAVK